MTSSGSHGVPSRRQKRMGPAPFASFEDLSDEVRVQVDSPEEKIDAGSVVRLPGIREDVTPSTPASLGDRAASPQFIYTGISLIGASGAMATPQPTTKSSLTPSTPRIDISRASSSSQHEDSRDSTPERELFEGHDPARAKLGLGFREEGALDLRSSTEELDFQDGKQKVVGKVEETANQQRKDSQSSEICMLSISGRTSRLSSIGSQGSTHSRVSNASHLSVISGQSGLSRSPSPHKMLLETSFCGTKPNENEQKADQKQGTKQEPDDLEKVILSRKHDPTKAILAEGISVSPKIKIPDKPIRKEKPSITITIDKPQPSPTNNVDKPKLPKTILSASGIEYTYIPLKGPLPEDPPEVQQQKLREIKSAPTSKRKSSQTKTKSPQERPSTSYETSGDKTHPKYIRIKLKPDHLYDDNDPSFQKPDTLELSDTNTPTLSEKTIRSEPGRSISSTPSASPKFSRHILKEPFGSSKSPSPSLSRKSSFASLFRSKEAIISPESPTIPTRRKSTLSGIIKDAGENLRERRRSRSKSRERDKNSLSLAPSSTESIDSKGKRNVFSLFKGSGKKPVEKARETDDIGIGSLSNVEFKFRPERCEMPGKYHETPLEGDSIRIPLHSPTYYEQKAFLQDLRSSSQGSQETVIENIINKDETIQKNGGVQESTKKIEDLRQNSTSSENVVFSTRLGSTNELFTTKLPKQKIEEVAIETYSVEKSIIEQSVNIESQIVQSKSVHSMAEVEIKQSIMKTPEINQENIQIKKDKENDKDVLKEKEKGVKKRPSKLLNDEDEHYSSESERDSEIDFGKKDKQEDDKVGTLPVEIERKGLVMLQDSFEDELPYIPTTLPQERSVAVPIVPIKQRGTFEMKVCPIERPRSTTPINPSCLEDYCEEIAENVTKTIEKLKISLPREDSIKSPRRPSNTNWAEFAEKKITQRRSSTTSQEPPESVPPPLPPKGIQKEWINFEEIPEKRKPPKRIQTIPSRGNIEVPESVLHDNVVYSYVNPEDCKCECHEINNARARSKENQKQRDVPEPIVVQEDELPLLQDEQIEEEKPLVHGNVERIKLDVTILDRRSVISDSSIDLSASVEHPVEANGVDCLRMPFTSDLGVSNSNRSSIVSQEETQSPEGSPNAFPKTS
nr:uncharacterized protein LOC111424143 isoform X1 [Onthophagus taurus]XP_022913343.1 uncharacterized protein LOC111424143 isoform X1 [Onthophagus taurus]XP_022913344.1 uncharacterized protein LOC111424143 isoform X1 [Onthophagus taurus]